jgi:hypothetical protein
VTDPRKTREADADPEAEDAPRPRRPPEPEDQEDRDPLDEALEESFPTSDPPASGQVD